MQGPSTAPTVTTWRKYVGRERAVVVTDRFGGSAAGGELLRHFGFTTEHVAETVRGLMRGG